MPREPHPYDSCQCGDYRHQHVGGTGRCLLGSLCTPGHCQKFRFAHGPSEADRNKPDPGRLVPPHGSGP